MLLTRRVVIAGLLAATAIPLPALADDLPRNIERLNGEQVRSVIFGKTIKLGHFHKELEIREDGTYFSDYGRPQLPKLRGKWSIAKDGTLKMKPTEGTTDIADYVISRKNGKYMQQAITKGVLDVIFEAKPLF